MYKEIVEGLGKIAERNLKKYGRLTPVAFLIKDNCIVSLIQLGFHTDMEKYAGYQMVGMAAKKFSADVVIMINDVALKTYTGKDAKYAMTNYMTEMPLSYPENMRQDGIFFFVVDIKERKTTGYFQRYERKDKELHFHKLKLLEKIEGLPEEIKESTKLKGGIPSSVFKGYDRDDDAIESFFRKCDLLNGDHGF